MIQRSYKILVVDDEQDICELLKFNLEIEGYVVDTAPSGEAALELMAKTRYDLALLDVMMEGISGFELARRLRASSETAYMPIIFITALDQEDNVVKGLNIGGDDYISKTLSMREIKARVKAVLRRAHKPNESVPESKELLCFDGMEIDLASKRLYIDNQEITLTRIEFELLLLLCKNEGKVLGREAILDKVWPNDAIVMGRTVDVAITRLRHKLGKYGSRIKTRVGYGYCFE